MTPLMNSRRDARKLVGVCEPPASQPASLRSASQVVGFPCSDMSASPYRGDGAECVAVQSVGRLGRTTRRNFGTVLNQNSDPFATGFLRLELPRLSDSIAALSRRPIALAPFADQAE